MKTMDQMKKIILTSLGVALVAFLIGGGTYAYFSDVEQMEDTTFTAGTLDLSIGDTTVPVAVDPLKPGDKDESFASWTLKNEGSIAGVLNVSVGVVSGEEGIPTGPEAKADPGGSIGLEDKLKVAFWIEQGTEKKYLKIEDDSLVWTTIASPPEGCYFDLNNFSSKSTTNPIAQDSGDPNLGTFHVAYDLPYETGNEVQGDICSFNITFTLRQQPQ